MCSLLVLFVKYYPVLPRPQDSQQITKILKITNKMPINVAIMRRKLCRDLKIVFVSGLIVSFFPEFPLSTHSNSPPVGLLGPDVSAQRGEVPGQAGGGGAHQAHRANQEVPHWSRRHILSLQPVQVRQQYRHRRTGGQRTGGQRSTTRLT